jgi:hypothetical protein
MKKKYPRSLDSLFKPCGMTVIMGAASLTLNENMPFDTRTMMSLSTWKDTRCRQRTDNKMDDFFEFMRCQGVEDPEGLMLFITEFLEKPGMIGKFSKAQLMELEQRLDTALAPFKSS